MSYMNIFTAAEWQKLQLSFCSLMPEVAIADGKIDKKERKALDDIINNSHNFKNDLVRELLLSVRFIVNDLQSFLKPDTYDIYDALSEATILLEKKVEEDVAYEYKRTLIAIGYYIANSSGSSFTGRVNDYEMDVIMKYLYFLKLSIDDLNVEPNIKRLEEFLISGELEG